MAITDRSGLPLAIHASSASPHEVTLVERTLGKRITDELPEHMLGDRAYDSDPLDERLKESGVKLIAPHKRGRVKPKTQDGRELRRFCHRWKVERFFA